MEAADLARLRDVLRRPLTHRQRRLLILLCLLYMLYEEHRLRRARRQRSFWVRPIFQNRDAVGAYSTLVQEIRNLDPESYFNYFQMTPRMFSELAKLVDPYIRKMDTVLRRSIPVEERLAITLRYLISGDLQRSIAYQFTVAHQTVSKIIRETCDALWTALQPIVMPHPTLEKFKAVAQQFWLLWDFPHCCGVIDCKHVQIKATGNSSTEFSNYKQTNSIVLLAVCDAAYRFLVVDIGSNGSHSSGEIFTDSVFGVALSNGNLSLPPPEPLPFTNIAVPSVIVGDTFPLKTYLMCPFPGRDLEARKAVFNYRLSRARQTIENAFGILGARFRILSRPIITKVETATAIVKACVCLHNYIKVKDDQTATNNRQYCPPRFVDYEGPDGVIMPGDWRSICAHDTGLTDLTREESNNHAAAAVEVRNTFMDFFVSPEGHVPWQETIMNRGWPTPE